MKSSQNSANTRPTKSDKKRQSSTYVDIGTPKVPLKKQSSKESQESLSDWAHAS
ncbi:MAG: hypothetical protein KME29_17000 [Calothrix sp. FI2-JRJ7]|uniref:hypothetical protein n=1 Tax=Dulcicalothrix desertica TaxID=32056 RepID=UPI00030303CE|nr:hypothetical protein [Dulcicalothrix desertica]MBW4601218.1 hypothetical protein [Calothrix sp. FI2-JRJ7]